MLLAKQDAQHPSTVCHCYHYKIIEEKVFYWLVLKGYKSRRHMKVIEIGGGEGEIEVDREIEKTARAAKTKGKRNTKRTRNIRKIRKIRRQPRKKKKKAKVKSTNPIDS